MFVSFMWLAMSFMRAIGRVLPDLIQKHLVHGFSYLSSRQRFFKCQRWMFGRRALGIRNVQVRRCLTLDLLGLGRI